MDGLDVLVVLVRVALLLVGGGADGQVGGELHVRGGAGGLGPPVDAPAVVGAVGALHGGLGRSAAGAGAG